MKFKFINENKVLVLDEQDEKVGAIFSPSGSGEDVNNAIQVCGFSDAFEYWACANFKDKKDIQLIYDDEIIPGKMNFDMSGCQRCYHEPCACEHKTVGESPFVVRTAVEVEKRLDYTHRTDAISEGNSIDLDGDPLKNALWYENQIKGFLLLLSDGDKDGMIAREYIKEKLEMSLLNGINFHPVIRKALNVNNMGNPCKDEDVEIDKSN